MTEHPVKGVDHVFLLVQDLDASRDAWERLGFALSPRGLHSAHKGSANHTIMFPNDYVELLGVVAETEGNADRRATLARQGEGLHAIACRIGDAEAAEAALAALGVRTVDRSSFSRPVTLPGGGEAEAAFSTLQFHPDETPLGICFMCQHLTPESVWIPELLEHPNGARAIGAVTAGCDDPRGAAEGFARLFAAGRVSPAAGGFEVRTGERSADLRFLTHEALAARYPRFDMSRTPSGAFAAIEIRVADPERVRAALSASGVAFAETAAGVAVGPSEACGAVVEFVAEPR